MSGLFDPVPPASTKLGMYRKLSPLASVRVSPFCLGGMSVGDTSPASGGASWRPLLGELTKESSFKLLDAFFEAGGNFIDTANS